MAQADRDLQQARLSAEEEIYEWACFAAHQAAAKAVKAIHLAHSQEMVGHVLGRLLKSAPVAVPGELLEKARVLDGYYIPTRYPNAHSEGAPFEHFGKLQSDTAILYADEIIRFAHSEVAKT